MKWKMIFIAIVATQIAEAQSVNFKRARLTSQKTLKQLDHPQQTAVRTFGAVSDVKTAAPRSGFYVDAVSPGSLNQSQCLAQGGVFSAEVDMNSGSPTYRQRVGTCYTQQAYQCRTLTVGVEGQLVGGSNDPHKGPAGNIGCMTRAEVRSTRGTTSLLAGFFAEANTLSIFKEIARPGGAGGINSCPRQSSDPLVCIPVSAALRSAVQACLATGQTMFLHDCLLEKDAESAANLDQELTQWENNRRAQMQALTTDSDGVSGYCIDRISEEDRAVGVRDIGCAQ